MPLPRNLKATDAIQYVEADTVRMPKTAPGEHLWTVLLMFRVNVERWDEPGYTPLFDRDMLINQAGPACAYCEEPYSPALAARPCPGDPTGVFDGSGGR